MRRTSRAILVLGLLLLAAPAGAEGVFVLSDDGRSLAVDRPGFGTVWIWNLDSAKTVAQFDLDGVPTGVAFLPGGRVQIASLLGGKEGGTLCNFAIGVKKPAKCRRSGGEPSYEFSSYIILGASANAQRSIAALADSADPASLAWLNTKTLARDRLAKMPFVPLGYAPAAQRVVGLRQSALEDGTGAVAAQGVPASVDALALSVDATTAVSFGSRDGIAHEWNLQTGQVRRRLDLKPHKFAAIGYSSASRILVVAGRSTDPTKPNLWVIDLITGKKVRELIGLAGRVEAVAVRPDGSVLARVGDTVGLWQTESTRLSATLHLGDGNVNSATPAESAPNPASRP